MRMRLLAGSVIGAMRATSRATATSRTPMRAHAARSRPMRSSASAGAGNGP